MKGKYSKIFEKIPWEEWQLLVSVKNLLSREIKVDDIY